MLTAALLSVVGDRSVSAVETMLRLAEGSVTEATIVEGARTDTVRFTTPLTIGPVDAPLDAVVQLQFPQHRVASSSPAGRRRFELWGDDLLYGNLVQLTADKCVVDVPGIGQVRLPRAAVQRIVTGSEEQDLVDLAIGADRGWEVIMPGAPWKEVAGKLVADQPRATIYRDVELPSRAVIELVVSWKGTPDWTLAFGVGREQSSADSKLRLEVWDDTVALVREAGDKADLAWLGETPKESRSLSLSLFLDQTSGELIVLNEDAEQLGQLAERFAEAPAMGGVQLVSRKGTTRLERLRIAPWDGALPLLAEASESWVRLVDQTVEAGDAFLFDPEAKIIVRRRQENVTYEPDEVREIVLASDAAVPLRPGAMVQAELLHGMQLTGKLVAITPHEITLTLPGGAGPVAIPIRQLTTLTVMNSADSAPWPENLGGARLESGRNVLIGGLVDSPLGDAAALGWRTRGTLAASPLRTDLSARIHFAEPTATRGPYARGRPPQQPNGAGAKTRLGEQPAVLLGNAIYLQSGDVVPAEVGAVDHQGVQIESDFVEATTVSHDQVRAVVLWDGATRPTLDEQSRKRLLRAPRRRAHRPPTHLLGTKDRDLLRCRLIAMNQRTVQIESRGEPKQLDRRYLAWIVWLQDAGPEAKGNRIDRRPGEMRAQAVRRDGFRLTMVVGGVEQGVLHGRSEALGTCRIPLTGIDTLLLNAAIDDQLPRPPFADWHLKN